MRTNRYWSLWTLAATVALCTTLVASSAVAEVIEFAYTGTVTYSSGTPMGVSAPVGTPVSGVIAWDPALAPTSSSGSASYYTQSAPSGMTVTIVNSVVESQGTNTFQVTNDYYGSDGISGFFSSVSVNSQPADGSMSFYLSDSTATVFSDTSLPTQLDAANFDMLTGGLYGSFSSGGGTVFFEIATISAAAAIDVAIDIKPSYIAEQSAGKIPVIIRTTADFDAATVDAASVRLGVTGNEAAPTMSKVISQGLLLIFEVRGTGITCGATSLTLTGQTTDGQSIQGTSPIAVSGC